MLQTDYNGWANRTTWNIMLWLDNDEGNYRCYKGMVEKHLAQYGKLTGRAAKRIALNVLGDRTPDGCKLTAKCVDWPAIAEAMSE